MKKKLLFLLILVGISEIVMSQTKILSIEDYANPIFRPKGLINLAWHAAKDEYSWIDATTGDMMNKDAVFGTITTLIKKDEIIAALKEGGLENVTNFTGFAWRTGDSFTFTKGNAFYELNVKTKKTQKIIAWPTEAENIDLSKKSLCVAYTSKNNLYVAQANDVIHQVSKDGSPNLVYGESVHRQEFGITKGTFWSPDEMHLAFYRMDQSMVSDYPMTDYRVTPAVLRNIKYPMAGSKSHQVTVGVYDVAKKTTVYLQTGEPADQYLTNIAWSPDSKSVYIQVLNRDQNIVKLNRYDAVTGKFDKTLITERHPQYVEPQHPIIFLPTDPNKFLYQSQKLGNNTYYQYNTNGDLETAYDTFTFPVSETLGFSADGKKLYYTTPYDFQIENHCFELDLVSGNTHPLTRNGGFHTVKMSYSGRYMLDNMVSQVKFFETRFVDTYELAKFEVIHSLENPLKDYKTGEISLVRMQAKDLQTELFARLIKPADFDPKKKYPVLYYVYGGPHAQMVQDKWNLGADLFLIYMASKGYVVFTIDNRGSGNRGFNFESATFRNLGKIEMEDQQIGIDFLKKQSYVDTTRMGCFGWSFGGFMTTSMMLKKPGTFKAAVAGGPVIDWKKYEIMYTERYMDSPEQNSVGYENANLLNSVENLKGRLMIIHGLEDDTVLPEHSADFVNKCIEKGVLIDYFPYPNHPHNVRGKDRIHLYKKIEDYFNRNL